MTLDCRICRAADFTEPWYRAAEAALKVRTVYRGHSAERHDFVNRKFWEWAAIVTALEQRGVVRPGARGLGFAVGTEPLPSYFASRGCDVLGTDLDAARSDANWLASGQHAGALAQLHQPELVDAATFAQRVRFQPADMRSIRGVDGPVDFLWSSCAMEHLGSLQAGIDFVLASANLLAFGGVAVHTTEFNVQSNDATVETGPSVIYRRRDLESLAGQLWSRGFRLAPVDWDSGHHPDDLAYDREPFFSGEYRHVKLLLGGFVSTSMLLVVERVG